MARKARVKFRRSAVKAAPLVLAVGLLIPTLCPAQSASTTSASVDGVKGVKKDAVETVKSVETPSETSIVKVPPIPPPKSVSRVESVKAESSATVATIQPVTGVSGIKTPKMENLEAALLMKEAADVKTAGGAKARGSAAALLEGTDEKPETPVPLGDGRLRLQEFEKLKDSGS